MLLARGTTASAQTGSPMLLAARVPYHQSLEELVQFVPQMLGRTAPDTNPPTTVHWLAGNPANTSVAHSPTASIVITAAFLYGETKNALAA